MGGSAKDAPSIDLCCGCIGSDWLGGSPSAISPPLAWLGDWLGGSPSAISPPLAWLVVIVLDVLKLMPRGADAGVILLVQRDPGNGFR
jgi:hypothetical protein